MASPYSDQNDIGCHFGRTMQGYKRQIYKLYDGQALVIDVKTKKIRLIKGDVMDKNTKAEELIDFKSNIDSGQEFGRDTIHLFCSPLFVRAMQVLYDKNIKTISCGSGKERGILPGITCDYDALSDENKEIAKNLIISPGQFRIGAGIKEDTTFAEFERQLLDIIEKFKQQQ